MLTIYNDQEVDYTSYDGGTLSGSRGPGNGLIIASGPNPDNETYTVTLQPGAGTWKQLGLEVVMDESLPGLRVARGADRLVITELEVESGGRKVPFVTGASNLSNQAPEYLPAGAIDGDPKTGWAINAYNETAKAYLALRFASPLETSADTVLTVRIRQDSELRRATMGRFRLALSASEFSWPTAEKGKEIPDAVLRALRVAEDKRTDAQKAAVAAHFQWAAPEAQAEVADVAKCEQAAALLENAIPRVMVSEAVTPTDTRILARGNWMDDSGEDGAARHPRLPRQARHRRPPRHAARSGELAGAAGQSADRAGYGQPPLAPVLRHGPLQGAGRPGFAGRMAHASRIARLAGRRIRAA